MILDQQLEKRKKQQARFRKLLNKKSEQSLSPAPRRSISKSKSKSKSRRKSTRKPSKTPKRSTSRKSKKSHTKSIQVANSRNFGSFQKKDKALKPYTFDCQTGN